MTGQCAHSYLRGNCPYCELERLRRLLAEVPATIRAEAMRAARKARNEYEVRVCALQAELEDMQLQHGHGTHRARAEHELAVSRLERQRDALKLALAAKSAECKRLLEELQRVRRYNTAIERHVKKAVTRAR